MRTFVAAVAAVTMIATGALAATSAGAPLAPGKAAGVKHAQDMDDETVWWLVGGGIVVGGIALVASGDSNGSVASGTLSTTTST